MSGARLPIVSDAASPKGNLLFVGKSGALQQLNVAIAFDDLGPEGFALKTAGQHLIIAGGRQRGTMYGVYAFLEKLGCRWYSPSCSVIPKRTTIALPPLDEIQRPAFEYRDPFFTEALEKDWAARNKCNGAFSSLDASTGGKVEYFPFVHTFYVILPPEKYFKDHPEYFALVDEKRRGEDAQLCLTNPEVLRLTVETVLGWMEQHPEARIYSVSQNDTEGWCECDHCQAVETEEGAHSGPILRFVNAVAAEVGKRHPEKLIDTLAYWYSENPPAKVRPLPNVRIRLCPIGACEAHPFEECPHDAYFLKNFAGWSKITNQLYIWHYNTNFSHYLLPFPDFNELAADLPMYKKHGVRGLFLEGCTEPGGGAENAELRSYVMAKLLWNTNADANALIDEFMAAYYGEAAKAMRAYFDLLHRQVRPAPNGRGNHMWIYTDPEATYLSREFLAQAAEIFREAQAAAANETTRARVRQARLSIDYTNLYQSMHYSVRNGSYEPADLQELKAEFPKFLSDVRSFGITALREGQPLAKDEEHFAKLIKSYSVVTLENAALKVHVVPELNGRVVTMTDKASGKDVLRHADPGERHYPDTGGLTVAVFPDNHSRGYEANWSLVAQPGPDELILAGSCSNGLKLVLKMRLDGATLRTETRVENTASAPLDAMLQAQFDADMRQPEVAAIAFRSRGRTPFHLKLTQSGQEPRGSANYDGTNQPDGEWQFVGANSGVSIVNRFAAEAVSRCSLLWSARWEHSTVLTVWSNQRSLGSGEAMTFETSYAVSRS